ncbi:aerobic cobaltochelatase subunit CobT [Candidatus Endolissoclinum faulkneri L2]|uniref:Aerobic cobaltochelatase subunit CobT n=1 Tax=Candidatus Endolissoclinum faulkneri L2 TaxID=1193729 RepID=K7YNG1_9PROT|nr:aerobic cobaltochelatase subunit CobT [Candidatus Endolissoclinum faulkneri]AFX99052.1 aerobic cobaltochelatase subunit CobT [Candidatus Endolissoclinum faulkneri L2]
MNVIKTSNHSNDQAFECFKTSIAACLRAMSGKVNLEVIYSTQLALNSSSSAYLPLPAKQLNPDTLAYLRGEADSIALYLKHHNKEIHARYAPKSQTERKIFDVMEQARTEALGALCMPGVAHNLSVRLNNNFKPKEDLDRGKKNELSLEDVMYLIAWESITGELPPKYVQELIGLWRLWLHNKVGNSLKQLIINIKNQNAFAQLVCQIITNLELVEPDTCKETTIDKYPTINNSEYYNVINQSNDLTNAKAQTKDNNILKDVEISRRLAGYDEINKEEDTKLLPDCSFSKKYGKPSNNYTAKYKEYYRIYTTEYDQVVQAEKLCSAEELQNLRVKLDQQINHLQSFISKLANRLQRYLIAHQSRSWEFDLDDGLLDTSRLSRVIASPLYPQSYKIEKKTSFRDTVISLLIDNSGSMRGRPITISAITADILTRTLERCYVKVEILGFTTVDWNGGSARKRWISSGSPKQPGRLNALRHIIYKSANLPWRLSRKSLGLMLREDILKENIDGEALMWAYNRIISRPEKRRILMVISDGTPMDDSTLSVNSRNYLEDHLRKIIKYIDSSSSVELVAIGIGYDVKQYYRRATTIVDAEQLGDTIMKHLILLFNKKNKVAL